MAKPTITNFSVQKLDNSKGALDLARKKWADAEFVPNDDYWLGHFDMKWGDARCWHSCGSQNRRRARHLTVQFSIKRAG